MRIIILFCLLSVSLSAMASDKDPEIDAFFSSYLRSYETYLNPVSGGDISVIMRFFYPQTLQVPPIRAPRLAKDRQALSKGFQFFIDGLQKKGAVGLRWADVQYVKLGDTHALASNVAHVIDKAGRVIDVRSSVYSLYRTDQGWQIFVIQSIKPEQAPILQPRSVQLD